MSSKKKSKSSCVCTPMSPCEHGHTTIVASGHAFMQIFVCSKHQIERKTILTQKECDELIVLMLVRSMIRNEPMPIAGLSISDEIFEDAKGRYFKLMDRLIEIPVDEFMNIEDVCYLLGVSHVQLFKALSGGVLVSHVDVADGKTKILKGSALLWYSSHPDYLSGHFGFL